MDTFNPINVTAGGIILTLIGAIITLAKLHDKRLEKIISSHQSEVAQMIADHKEEMRKLHERTAAQADKVIEIVREDSAAKVQLSRSIDENKQSQKENTDKLSEAFYAIIRQSK